MVAQLNQNLRNGNKVTVTDEAKRWIWRKR